MEVYRENPTKVPLPVPAGAINISVKVVRDSVVLSTINPTVVNGLNLVAIPYSALRTEGQITLEVTFYIDGVKYDTQQKIDVVTPILPVGRIQAILGDAEEWEIKRAERIVRSTIESFTGINFGLYSGALSVQGQGESFLKLPKRLLTLKSITANNLLLDTIRYTVVSDGWYLKVNAREYLTIKEAPPDRIVAPGTVSAFQDNLQYIIDGDWGYHAVPMDIQDAAALLVEDYSCPTNKYRDSYLKSISTDSGQMVFGDGLYSGTGNARVDMILEKYRMIDMVII